MPVKVKICGITRLPDALAAVEAGADLLGFNFWERSPRYLTPTAAAEIIRALPPGVVKAGVFVNPTPDAVAEAIRQCGLDLLQFHGDEPPDFCLQFGLMTMKAFRIQNAASLRGLAEYRTDAWLLDAFVPGQPGGTGTVFNWDLALEAQRHGRPVFLAGGLTSENVGEAIRRVQPYGVDVCGGVESAPGQKDAQKVRAFIAAAKNLA